MYFHLNLFTLIYYQLLIHNSITNQNQQQVPGFALKHIFNFSKIIEMARYFRQVSASVVSVNKLKCPLGNYSLYFILQGPNNRTVSREKHAKTRQVEAHQDQFLTSENPNRNQ